MTSRREFVSGALGLGLAAGLSPVARALGEDTRFRVAQLRYDGNWDPRPAAPGVMAQEIRFRTSIDVELERHVLGPQDPGLFRNPFLLLLGDGQFRFDLADRQNLRKWIEAGGFLFADNAGRSQPSDAFDASLRAELETMFPGHPFQRVPPQHVLFRTFYVLDFPPGRAIHRTWVEAVFIEERLAVLYAQNDVMGALDRDPLGAWSYDVVPGGETQRERVVRFAVNIAQYSLCLDYKDDQVHTDYLLHQRRWKVNPPKIETP